MAVLRLNYCKNPHATERAKAHVRYISQRPNMERERQSRQLFSFGGNKDISYADSIIKNAPKGARFFKLIFSTDPKREDTYRDLPLRRIFEQMMYKLEQELGGSIEYVAAIHDDHTDVRHIHSLIIHKGRISRDQLLALRKFATRAARRERGARDIGRPKAYKTRQTSAYYSSSKKQHFGSSIPAYRVSRIQPCPNCLAPMDRSARQCSSCGQERIRPYSRGGNTNQKRRGGMFV